jgi:hypothetical protein
MKEEFPVGQPEDVVDFKNLPKGTSKKPVFDSRSENSPKSSQIEGA